LSRIVHCLVLVRVGGRVPAKCWVGIGGIVSASFRRELACLYWPLFGWSTGSIHKHSLSQIHEEVSKIDKDCLVSNPISVGGAVRSDSILIILGDQDDIGIARSAGSTDGIILQS